MRRLIVEHKTRYRYSEPVQFGQHRLMLRPRDSHGLRLHEARLTLSPSGDVKYIYDVFGNSIALVDFHAPAAELVIESVLELDSYATPDLQGLLDPAAAKYPFVYSSDDRFDASQMLTPHYEDGGEVKEWLTAFVKPGEMIATLDLLQAINAAIKSDFTYQARIEEGTQTPAETLKLKTGTCRDFAMLFIEAVRELGFAARFVTGYLYTPHLDLNLDHADEIRGAGATHAWAEVYLPGAGWVDFDPTNALIGTDHLVRVAVVRDPRQASPIVGSFISDTPCAFLGMDVEVFVSTRLPGTEGSPVKSSDAAPLQLRGSFSDVTPLAAEITQGAESEETPQVLQQAALGA